MMGEQIYDIACYRDTKIQENGKNDCRYKDLLSGLLIKC